MSFETMEVKDIFGFLDPSFNHLTPWQVANQAGNVKGQSIVIKQGNETCRFVPGIIEYTVN